ncbi:MAG: disulfide bond formation protein B, partial [Gammaproteobacteria bacterium]|nr:disulfide bond formation protein B [Gammaproteobacteria bacterium]
MNWLTAAPRRMLALISVACVAMLAFGMYLQHVVGLEPCPMCIVQRYALIAVALFAGLA